ncbi:argininosuccinate synthase [Drosophila grimshawi]|uniref:Argininosuccinate synthase n=1 Tax=Drosophila grimshawi TaxID=7222 RepID=B4JUJ3_DROGR|nr:argininosuccinate synthase [Drosophila grimshawi]EDV91163.1 GH17302 [Drosophila grimshawi]
MAGDKVILAYSGGLDTSCILKWLLEQRYEVICVLADVGQQENFEAARQKALKIGAKEVIVADIKQNFVEQYIWPAIQMGLIYEERYLLGTSLARPCISVALIEAARRYDAKYLAHGATGKGNDQVRFELCAYALQPDLKIIAPWRDVEFCRRFQGRQDLIAYAHVHGIEVTAKPATPWSTDANMLHISYESGILEDPNTVAPSSLYELTLDPLTQAPQTARRVCIHFVHGLPTVVEDLGNSRNYTIASDMLKFLNDLGGSYGIGRIDIVENRYVGLKSRGVYETPGGTILYTAHQDLEVFALDREVLRTKQLLRDRMSDYVYNGFWFSPEALYVRRCIELSQQHVTGQVTVELAPGYCRAIARKAGVNAGALYNQQLVSMDEHGGYVPQDAGGFIAINAVRIREHVRAFGAYNTEQQQRK